MTTTGSATFVRNVASVVTTNASTAITGPAGSFSKTRDVGAPITGTGIAANTTIASVASATAATLSQNASAGGTVTVAIGPRLTSSAGFLGWKPETDAREGDYTVTANNAGTAPLDKLADNITRTTQYVQH